MYGSGQINHQYALLITYLICIIYSQLLGTFSYVVEDLQDLLFKNQRWFTSILFLIPNNFYLTSDFYYDNDYSLVY